MRWLFGFDIQFTDDDWREIVECCMHNEAHPARVIRMTGSCLPGIN